MVKFSDTKEGTEVLNKFINKDTSYIHALGCNKVIDDRQVKLMFIPIMNESFAAGQRPQHYCHIEAEKEGWYVTKPVLHSLELEQTKQKARAATFEGVNKIIEELENENVHIGLCCLDMIKEKLAKLQPKKPKKVRP